MNKILCRIAKKQHLLDIANAVRHYDGERDLGSNAYYTSLVSLLYAKDSYCVVNTSKFIAELKEIETSILGEVG